MKLSSNKLQWLAYMQLNKKKIHTEDGQQVSQSKARIQLPTINRQLVPERMGKW